MDNKTCFATPVLDLLPTLRKQVEDLSLVPGCRIGSDFYRHHVTLVEHFSRRLAPLFGADLTVVLPAAILHDIAAIEDFSLVARHHELGALRAQEILLERGIDPALAHKVAECCRMHPVPVDIEGHGPDAACLSHADALAQLADPAFWLHYAGFVRGLGFSEGRDWYRALLLDRRERLSPLAAPLALPLLERALEICRDIPQQDQTEEIRCS